MWGYVSKRMHTQEYVRVHMYVYVDVDAYVCIYLYTPRRFGQPHNRMVKLEGNFLKWESNESHISQILDVLDGAESGTNTVHINHVEWGRIRYKYRSYKSGTNTVHIELKYMYLYKSIFFVMGRAESDRGGRIIYIYTCTHASR